MLKLLVGLGNPGAQYEHTRHNAGFWFIDQVAFHWKTALAADRHFHGLWGRTDHNGHPIWLLQPQTFMNASGKSVAALAKFFKIEPHEIMVAHDELDLPPGEIKLKRGGSHAGHNGLRDIHAQLGSSDYWRLRIGVGHPGQATEVVGWVLKKAPTDQMDLIATAMDRAWGALPLLLSGQTDKATAQIHTRQAPRPKPPRPLAAPAPQQTS